MSGKTGRKQRWIYDGLARRQSVSKSFTETESSEVGFLTLYLLLYSFVIFALELGLHSHFVFTLKCVTSLLALHDLLFVFLVAFKSLGRVKMSNSLLAEKWQMIVHLANFLSRVKISNFLFARVAGGGGGALAASLLGAFPLFHMSL